MDELKLITPLSHGLPKTGRITEIIAGDDGTYERGWWLGTLNDNNRTRFIEKEYVTDEPIIIDLATHLIWPKDLNSVATDTGAKKNLSDAIAFCEALDFGGFDDWYMPNILEMCSLVNSEIAAPSAYTNIFDNWIATLVFHTATMYPDSEIYCQDIDFLYGLTVAYGSVGTTTHFLPVRSM